MKVNIDTAKKYNVTGISIPEENGKFNRKQISPELILTGADILHRIAQTEYVIAQLRFGMENLVNAPEA
jgi:hypothetical protein